MKNLNLTSTEKMRSAGNGAPVENQRGYKLIRNAHRSDHVKEKQFLLEYLDAAKEIFALFDERLNLEDMNEAGIRLLGYVKKEDAIGLNIKKLSPEIKKSTRLQKYKEVLRTGKRYDFNESISHPNFGNRHFIIKAFKVGKGLGLILEDDTERREAELRQEYLLRKLETANKELEEITYVTSHDLKGPVINLRALLEIMKHRKGVKENCQDIFEKSEACVNQMYKKLVTFNEVLAFQETLNEDKVKIYFGNVLREAKQKLKKEIKLTGAVIEADFTKCPFISYSKLSLETLFFHLLSNSIKYARPGITPEVNILSEITEGQICLTFRDNGLGINPKISKDKIFGLFKRVHAHVPGDGVGLYLAHWIVKANGGKMEVESEVNKMTTFKVHLGHVDEY